MPSLKTVQTDALKIRMIQLSLTVEAFAEKCGVSIVTMRNQISQNFPSRRLRLVAEGVLKLAIWTTNADFERRQQLSSWLGIDPFVLSVPELRKKVSQLKIRGRAQARRRPNLIALLKKHFIAQSEVAPPRSYDRTRTDLEPPFKPHQSPDRKL